MEFTIHTLKLFEHLLNQVQVPASATDFREVSDTIANAKDQLSAALAEVSSTVD